MPSALTRSRVLLLAWLCALATTLVAAATPGRIVAVGDIHGSFDSLVAILTRSGLIDESRRWSGGTTRLVQTGDYMDRGDGVRAVIDLLMTLEPQARKAGGELIVLLGNHEVMNLIGETRDVTPAIFATFADGESAERREQAWRQYEELARTRRTAGAPVPGVYSQSREAWMAAHPPGYVEYREAVGPQGIYGRWLRTRTAAVRLEKTVFMHAGADPASELNLEDVNRRIRNELARFDAYVRTLVDRKLALSFFSLLEVIDVTAGQLKMAVDKIAAQKEGRDAPSPQLSERELREAAAIYDIANWTILSSGGPMWFRGYATWPETAGPGVATVLERFRAERLVVAHTPLASGTIRPRFDNRVFLIDTGMLTSVYKGRPSALEIDGPRVSALYPGEEAVPIEQ